MIFQIVQVLKALNIMIRLVQKSAFFLLNSITLKIFSASDDKSDLTIADDLIDHERVQKVKEEIQDKVIKRQREKDLEELYGIVDDTSSSEEDEQRSNAIKELNEPYTYLKPKSYPKYNYSSESDDDSVNAAAKRERVKKREKQMQEMVDNVIWASLSLGKQSAILFGKMINYSAKYPVILKKITIASFLLYFLDSCRHCYNRHWTLLLHNASRTICCCLC